MDTKIDNNNIVSTRRVDGKLQYIVNLGHIIYNDKILNLSNLIIPILNRDFFNLPEDRDKYTVVNVYYKIETGSFIFDKIAVYNKNVNKVDAPSLFNLIPIAQFVLHQVGSYYEVDHINEFSKMSTFTITSTFEKGEKGLQGPMGFTGMLGFSGVGGPTGSIGDIGSTGPKGLTGVGQQGYTGLKGEEGVYPDPDLILYLKFKSDDFLQTDYSIYENDCMWSVSGTDSIFTRETGIVDNCHSLTYTGGFSAYKRNEYLDYGVTAASVHAWVRADLSPAADFEVYSGNFSNPLQLKFEDTSKYFPDEWFWDFGDGGSSEVQNPLHIFPTYNEYIVKLTAKNETGSSIKYKSVVL